MRCQAHQVLECRWKPARRVPRPLPGGAAEADDALGGVWCKRHVFFAPPLPCPCPFPRPRPCPFLLVCGAAATGAMRSNPGGRALRLLHSFAQKLGVNGWTMIGPDSFVVHHRHCRRDLLGLHRRVHLRMAQEPDLRHYPLRLEQRGAPRRPLQVRQCTQIIDNTHPPAAPCSFYSMPRAGRVRRYVLATDPL